jgi:hypothetical protein
MQSQIYIPERRKKNTCKYNECKAKYASAKYLKRPNEKKTQPYPKRDVMRHGDICRLPLTYHMPCDRARDSSASRNVSSLCWPILHKKLGDKFTPCSAGQI